MHDFTTATAGVGEGPGGLCARAAHAAATFLGFRDGLGDVERSEGGMTCQPVTSGMPKAEVRRPAVFIVAASVGSEPLRV